MDGERGIPLKPPGSFLNAAHDPDTVAYTSHVSSDTWFAHSSARLAHVANVLHVVFFLTAAAARSHTHTVDAARGDTHTV